MGESHAEQPKAPEAPKPRLPYYADTKNSIAPQDFIRQYPEQEKLADTLVGKAKTLTPKIESESETDYQKRMFDEVESRLRLPGNYKDQKDTLFDTIEQTPGMDQPHYTLMAVEAKRALYVNGQNEQLTQQAQGRLDRVFRRDVKTEVAHVGEPSYVEGDYEHYFDEQQKPKELPKTDLYAFTLVADQLLDITDPAVQTAGETKSYRQQMKELEDVMKDKSTPQAQRDQMGRKLISLRSQFYSMAIEAIRTVDQPQYVNPDETSQLPKDKVLTQMYQQLKNIRRTPIDELIMQYKGVNSQLSPKHKNEMSQLLSGQKPRLLDFALKGADILQRRVSFNPTKPKLHPTPDKIFYKKFVQGGEDKNEERGTPKVVPPKEDGKPENLQPDPNGDKNGEPPVAPVEEEPVRVPETPEGAPVDEPKTAPEPPAAPIETGPVEPGAPESTDPRTPPQTGEENKTPTENAPSPSDPEKQKFESVYYDGQTLESLREWLRADPSRLHTYSKIKDVGGKVISVDKEGAPIQRSVERERKVLKNYLEKLSVENPQYHAYLESLANTPAMQPMGEECRVAVNIPAWMEGKIIYKTLDLYTAQTDKNGQKLDPSLYEINIIINRKTGTQPDNSVAEIERFIADKKAQGENYRINFVDVAFDPPFNNVGHARKVITDLTLLRSLRRTNQTKALYIESEDADLLRVDPKTVVNLFEKFDVNPHLDALRGVQDRLPEEMMKNDYLFLDRRLGNFVELYLRRKRYHPENNPRWNSTWNRVVTGGWNTGYTAEAIALIGGYNSRAVMGEDMEIGQKISMIRGDGINPNLDTVGTIATRSDSSPRRYLVEVLTGKGAYSDAFADEKLNNFIRTASLDELHQAIASSARITTENQEIFRRMLENNLRYFVRNLTPTEEEARRVFDSGMFWLGFKKEDYEYGEKGKLIVKDWSHLQSALEDYRARHAGTRGPGERIGHYSTTDAAVTTELPKPTGEPTHLTEVPPLQYELSDLQTSTDTFIKDNYTICLDKPLGSGYLGEVFAGYNTETDTLLAFKRVNKYALKYLAENSGFPPDVEDPEDAVKAIASNPNLLVYQDKIETEGDNIYKIYPLASTDLNRYLINKRQIEPTTAVALTMQIVEALQDLHQNNILHLDVGPENILVNKDGQGFLYDLDAVITKGPGGIYERAWGGGSAYIIPPELFESPILPTESTDTYEASILLYRILTGVYPYESKAESLDEKTQELYDAHKKGGFTIPDSVPEPLRPILKKGISPNPADRYQTATELLGDLKEAYEKLEPTTQFLKGQEQVKTVETNFILGTAIQHTKFPGIQGEVVETTVTSQGVRMYKVRDGQETHIIPADEAQISTPSPASTT